MRRQLTVCTIMLVLGAPIGAQPDEPADTRAAREAVERFAARSAEEDASLATGRQAWLEQRTLDTIDLVGVRWIVDRPLTAQVRRAVAAVDAKRALGGLPPFADLLGRRVAYVLASSPPRAVGQPAGAGMITFDHTLNGAIDLGRSPANMVESVLLRVLAANAWTRADLRLRQWAGSAIMLGPGPVGPEDLRLQLLVIDDPRGWACARGELPACEAALFDSTTVAFAGALRAGLARTALSLGGAAAWGRLLADSTAPIARRLEAAAQQPVRTIVERWYAEALTLPPQRPMIAGVWVLAFAALSSVFGRRRAR